MIFPVKYQVLGYPEKPYQIKKSTTGKNTCCAFLYIYYNLNVITLERPVIPVVSFQFYDFIIKSHE